MKFPDLFPDRRDHDPQEPVPLPVFSRPGLEEPLKDLCLLRVSERAQTFSDLLGRHHPLRKTLSWTSPANGTSWNQKRFSRKEAQNSQKKMKTVFMLSLALFVPFCGKVRSLSARI
jgi:hypothetical protein